MHTEKNNNALVSYVVGFLGSIVLSLAAYAAVTGHYFANTTTTTVVVVVLALAQLAVQLFCFLHLGQEEKPRTNLLAFVFAAMVVIIVVVGTLWIMYNLNHNMMPVDIDTYLRKQN